MGTVPVRTPVLTQTPGPLHRGPAQEARRARQWPRLGGSGQGCESELEQVNERYMKVPSDGGMGYMLHSTGHMYKPVTHTTRGSVAREDA